MSRAAATRKYRKAFDPKPFYELVGATINKGGLAVLPNGWFVDFAGWKPGKVTAHVMTKTLGGSRRRTFGIHQHNEIAEWVLSGELESEEHEKRVKAHAWTLLDALKEIAEHPTQTDGRELKRIARAAIAKATGGES